MLKIGEDKSISVTRGDSVVFGVSQKSKDGTLRVFNVGDVVRFTVVKKKDYSSAVLQKDFAVEESCEVVDVVLTSQETRIGDAINKAVEYWYEVEVNPETSDTIIGHDESGAKLFWLYPEAEAVEQPAPDPEEIPVVDGKLDVTSERPVENRVVAKAILFLEEESDNLSERVDEIETQLGTLTSRVKNLSTLKEGSTTGDAELIDTRVGYDGTIYESAGEAVRSIGETVGKVIKISPNLFDVDKGFTDGYRPANTIDLSGGVEGFVPPLTNSYAGWKTWMGSILVDGGATICGPSNFTSRIWCYPVIDGATTVNVAVVLTNANSTATADGTGMYWSIPTAYDRYLLSVGTQSYSDLSGLMLVEGSQYPSSYQAYGENRYIGSIRLEQISDYEPYLNGNLVPIDSTKVSIEETHTQDGSIYVKWGWMHNYADEYGTSFTNIYNTLTSYQCPESPSGLLTNCLQIPSKKAICYNKKTKTIEGVSSRSIDDKNHIILAQCNNGRITGGYFMSYPHREFIAAQGGTNTSGTETDKESFDFASRVVDKQTPHSLTLGLMTDSHVDFYNQETYSVKLDQATKFATMPAYVQTRALIHGGDILATGYDDKTRPQETLTRYCAALNLHAKADLVVLKGNHDDNCYGATTDGQLNINKSVDSIIGQSEWFKRAMASGIANTDFVRDGENPYGGYGYFDDEASKIRVICLNTGEVPEILNDAGTDYAYNMYYLSAMSNAQLNFVANALRFADKSNPNEWAVLFVSHIPLETVKQSGTLFGITDMKPRGADVFFGIVNAYRDGASYTTNSTDGPFLYDVSCSYNHAGEVVAFLCGHTHHDNTSDAVGGAGSPEYGYRFISVDSKAFANLVIDRTHRTINVLKFNGNSFVDPQTDPYGTIVGLTADDVNEYGDWVCSY